MQNYKLFLLSLHNKTCLTTERFLVFLTNFTIIRHHSLIQKLINKLRSLANQKLHLAYCRRKLLFFVRLIQDIFHSVPFHFKRIPHNLPKLKWLSFIKFSKGLFLSVAYHFERIFNKLPRLSTLPYFAKSRIIVVITALVIIIAIIGLSTIHNRIYQPNITKTTIVFIPTGSNYQQIINLLEAKNIFRNFKSFDWFAKKKNYPVLIKPGAYRLEEGWSNREVVQKLRSGIQTPVKVTFNNIRFRENLAGRVANYLEADSISFLTFLNSDSLAKSFGLTNESFPCIFIPNTYEFYWNTSPRKFVERMKKEYDTFWTASRKEKAAKLGLSLPDVSTLASIVQEESIMKDEKPRIAGVYLNRLRHDWLLQADPTVKFALKDFTIKRILYKYTKIDSPFNTYIYKGLPPGPINLPDIESIESVLNAENHDYMYFCARDDFSGYHYFSKTLSEHNNYAIKYRKALNRKNIMR